MEHLVSARSTDDTTVHSNGWTSSAAMNDVEVVLVMLNALLACLWLLKARVWIHDCSLVLPMTQMVHQ
jgi:predicted membrane-bound mannosyltransferase